MENIRSIIPFRRLHHLNDDLRFAVLVKGCGNGTRKVAKERKKEKFTALFHPEGQIAVRVLPLGHWPYRRATAMPFCVRRLMARETNFLADHSKTGESQFCLYS